MFTPVSIRPLCSSCSNDDRDGALTVTAGGEELCLSCHEAYVERMAEMQSEGEGESYYGGSSMTVKEARIARYNEGK